MTPHPAQCPHAPQLIEILKTQDSIRRVATDPFMPQAMRNKIVAQMFKGVKDCTEVTKRLVGEMSASWWARRGRCTWITMRTPVLTPNQQRPCSPTVCAASPCACACPLGAAAEALADENSLSALVQVTLAYEELMLAHKKEVHCTIVTAQVHHVLRQPGGGGRAASWPPPLHCLYI